ncbi:hypothetical protein PHYSODRAFT_457905, partial [Phytophthora sojae]
NPHSQSRVFDPGKAENRVYFQKYSRLPKPVKYLIKDTVCVRGDQQHPCRTFFDEGADFCGVSEAFVRKHNLEQAQVPNRVVPLTIVVDNIEPFVFDFKLCYVPNKCDLMLGVPWKRAMVPIIDWETDRIYSKDQYRAELERAHYCARWGFTKHVSLKAARTLVRKSDVEF